MASRTLHRAGPRDPAREAIIVRRNWIGPSSSPPNAAQRRLNDYARANDRSRGSAVSRWQSSVQRHSASPDSFRIAGPSSRYENGQLAATDRWTAHPSPSSWQAAARRRTPEGQSSRHLRQRNLVVAGDEPMIHRRSAQPENRLFRKSASALVLLSSVHACRLRQPTAAANQLRRRRAAVAGCSRRGHGPDAAAAACPAGLDAKQGRNRRRHADRPRRERQCRRPRRAASRGLLQRHPDLPLERRRALSGLCRCRPDHQHRARTRRKPDRRGTDRSRRPTLAGSSATRERFGYHPARACAGQADAPRHLDNLVITTDRRTYMIELRARDALYMPAVAWAYPAPPAGQRQSVPATTVIPAASARNYRYGLTGDTPPGGRSRSMTTAAASMSNSRAASCRARCRRLRHRLGRRAADRQQPHPPEHPDRRPSVRRGRTSSWRRRPPADRQDRPKRREARVMSDTETTPAAPMRLRADAPRVTRLSRKVLAGIGVVASLGIGGALIYALRPAMPALAGTSFIHTTTAPRPTVSRACRATIRPGPRAGAARRPRPTILDAQNRGQPVVPPAMTTPAVDPEEQRRLAEEEAARLSRVSFRRLPARSPRRSGGRYVDAQPRRPWPAWSDGNADGAGPTGGVPQRSRRPAYRRGRSRLGPGVALRASGGGGDFRRAHHRLPFRSARTDHRAGHGARLRQPDGRILLVPQGTRIIGHTATMSASGNAVSCSSGIG